MTAYNIIKSLSRKGNAVIGAGCYAAALECRTDTSKIIKIGNNIDDPWLSYYYLLIKNNQHNICIPRIESLYIDDKHNFYVCIMERLIQRSNDYENAAKKIIKDYAEQKIDKNEFVDAIVDYPKAVPSIGSMLQVLDKIIENSTYTYNDYEDDARVLDLHAGNILARSSGALVITDPWCQTEDIMADMEDLESWAERNLRIQEQ